MKQYKNIQKEIRQNFLHSGEYKFLFRILTLLELSLNTLNYLKNEQYGLINWFENVKRNYPKIKEVLENKFLMDKIKIDNNANLKDVHKNFLEFEYLTNNKFNDNFFKFDLKNFENSILLEALHFVYKYNYKQFVNNRLLSNKIKRIERCFDWLNKNSLENRLSSKELACLITFETCIYTLPEEVVKVSKFCYKSKNQDSKFYVFIIDEIPVIIKDKKKLLQKSDFRQLLKITK